MVNLPKKPGKNTKKFNACFWVQKLNFVRFSRKEENVLLLHIRAHCTVTLFLTTVGGEVRQSQNLCDVVCDYPLSTVITKAKYSGDPIIQLVHQMLFVLWLNWHFFIPEFACHPTWHSQLLNSESIGNLDYLSWCSEGESSLEDLNSGLLKVQYSDVSSIWGSVIKIPTVYQTAFFYYPILNVFLF